MKILKVSKSYQTQDEKNYCFTTVSAAIKALPRIQISNDPITIQIYPGVYYEKITLNRNHVSLIGMGTSNKDVVLTYDDYALKGWDKTTKYGTFRSYTFLLDASHVVLENLTISNTSGDENKVGQAIALYAEGNQILVNHCRLLGRQDTLFTGPLPEQELQPGGFVGPKQNAPRINGFQHYKNTYICGNIDFIFGSASAYFEQCEIESLSHGESHEVQGYVTAPSTQKGQPYGYVFQDCHFLSKECRSHTVYLGRPWREYAKSVFISCTLGSHIHPALFHDWNKPMARQMSFFAIANLMNEDSSSFLSESGFYHILSSEEIESYTPNQIESAL